MICRCATQLCSSQASDKPGCTNPRFFAAHLAHAFNHVHIDWEHLVDYSFPNLLCDSNTGNSNESELTKLFKHIQLSTEKAIGSLTELGVTIVMGMITTFMAGVVLINGTLYFFQENLEMIQNKQKVYFDQILQKTFHFY